MLVLVTGSPTWDDPEPIRQLLAKLPEVDGGGITILHGGTRVGGERAGGADWIADGIARRLGYEVTIVPAEQIHWDGHGKKAQRLRDIAMLDYTPELVLAFIRDDDAGTSHVIAEARRRGIDVLVTHWEDRQA